MKKVTNKLVVVILLIICMSVGIIFTFSSCKEKIKISNIIKSYDFSIDNVSSVGYRSIAKQGGDVLDLSQYF